LLGNYSNQKVIARLPVTVPVKVGPANSYDFTVPEDELRFFDSSTELRIPAQSV